MPGYSPHRSQSDIEGGRVAEMAGCRVVYFSSVSENTHRFVGKLGVPAVRIPLHGRIEVDEPYVLVLPTYGGGHATPDINDGDTSRSRSSPSSTTSTTARSSAA